jgi:hypothetical protein
MAVVALLVVGLPMTPGGIEPAYSADDEAAPEPAPPAGQEYTGAKRCASCHFEEYMAWKSTGHAKSFDLLTSKYEKDPKCLKCHTTGYGQPTGYKTSADTALQGTTCEACHGPGSKHEEVSQPFAKKKTLTPEEEKLVNDSIWRMLPKNVCVQCHAVQGHKKSETPPELKKKK